MAIFLALLFTGATHAGLEVTFNKAFNPGTIGPGSVSTLTFTITNPDPTTPRDMLAFTDVLPAGVTIASPSQARSFCGGTLSAPNGGTTITFSDGMLGASQSCTIRVDVTSSTPGTHMNVSGTLTSDAGSHGTASADLDVANDRPGFTKGFFPSSVTLGGRSMLVFTIDNLANQLPATTLNFSDTLPPGMVVANPANASTSCGSPPTVVPTLNATPGSNVISLSYLGTVSFPGVGGNGICFVDVDVVGGAVGMLGNTSGELLATVSGTENSSGKAAAVLTVTGGASEPILLTKEFTDDPVPPGGNVTLRFTITNTDRDFSATGIGFTDDLNAALAGLTFTSVGANTCDATPTGTGTTTLSFAGGSLAPDAACSFDATLAVPGGAFDGTYSNSTSAVTATVDGNGVMGSPAGDTLFVVSFPLLTKEFTDDPVGAGDTVTLEFTISNTSTASALDFITFIDELTAGTDAMGQPTGGFLPFPVSVGLPPMPDPPCGVGSSLALISTGTDRQGLELTGGNLATAGTMGDSCTFSVTVDIPAGFPQGNYTNTTGPITGTLSDLLQRKGEFSVVDVTGPGASDVLAVVGPPTLSKEFTDDPTPPGGTATLQFTLTHDALAPVDATGIAFSDDLTTVVTGLVAASVDSSTCAGATVDISTPTLIDFAGGTLMPGETCVVSVSLTVPAGALPGRFTNTTSDVTATVGGVATTGNPAEDDLRVAGLNLSKEFTDDPAIPGDTVNLRFTLDNTSGTGDATAILFNDDLGATLSGLTATGLPFAACGGTVAAIPNAGTIDFSGGTVLAGASCFFDVTLQVPAGAPNGPTVNATSNLFATIGASPGFVLDPATDVLIVDDQLLSISKSFTDDPAVPGGPVTLELIIENLDLTRAASAIAFSDDLDAALSGLTVGMATSDDCGGTPAGAGTGVFSYSGGSLATGGTCTVTIGLNVPAGPLPGNTFTNTTSTVTGTINGFGVSGAAASDDLRVVTLTLDKSFGGVGFPGQTVDLNFTITNLDGEQGAGNLSFSDTLPGGLTAVAPLPMVPCGAGSTISGTTFLSFSGGSLAAAGSPGDSCTFPVTVQVPAAASPGMVLNTTSDLFSSGLSVSGPGSDTLLIEAPPTFAKAFAPGSIGIGQTSTLSFSIDNSASTVAATGLAFNDNLPAGVEVAATPSVNNTCGGTVTATAGGGVISLAGGSVAAAMSCLVQVNVTATAAGTFVNTTGDLTSSSGNSGPASDTLTVNPQPTFAKVFAPNPIVAGAVSTLTFTVDNSGSTVSATGLDFTDNLPAAVALATPANATTDCTGGTLTAPNGGGTIGYSGGSVANGASCTVSADVTSSTPGMHLNTSADLTSSLGNSGPAGDTLIVNAGSVPVFSKAFAPPAIGLGGVSTLTFSIDNSASLVNADNLDFTDNLPAGVLLATPANAATTCTGGTLTAPAGGGTIGYAGGSVAAGASCTVSADVTSMSPGMHVNTSGDLTSTLGNSGPASATLDVAGNDLSLAKAFVSDPVLPGGLVAVEFTITNSSTTLGAGGIAFTDDLNGAIPGLTATGLPINACGGTLTGASAGTMLTFSAGSLGASSSCVIAVTLRVPASAAPGLYTNTTGSITGDMGGAPAKGFTVPVIGAPASATFNVAFLSFSKIFAADVPVGGIAMLGFTISNPDPANTATAVGFTDDLNAFIPGAEAIGLPQSNVCGAVSQVSGTSVITLTGGTLGPGASCTFQVQIQVPDSIMDGDYTNTTGPLQATVGGTVVTGAGAVVATAVLGVGAVMVVPAMNAWGLLLLAGLLLLVSARRLRGVR